MKSGYRGGTQVNFTNWQQRRGGQTRQERLTRHRRRDPGTPDESRQLCRECRGYNMTKDITGNGRNGGSFSVFNASFLSLTISSSIWLQVLDEENQFQHFQEGNLAKLQ